MSYSPFFKTILDGTLVPRSRASVLGALKIRSGRMRPRRLFTARSSRGISPYTPASTFSPGETTDRPLLLINQREDHAAFRLVLRQRVARHSAGEEVGPITVFTGEQGDLELLEAHELGALEAEGLSKIFTSGIGEHALPIPCRLWAERTHIAALLQQGVDVYFSGDGRFTAPAVRNVLQRIYSDATTTSKKETDRWWAKCLEGTGEVRYFEDLHTS